MLSSVVMLIEGHALSHPEIRVTHMQAVVQILFFTAGAALSSSFPKHNLILPDRFALFVFVSCFFWQAAAPRFTVIALCVGFFGLIAAWAYDQLERKF